MSQEKKVGPQSSTRTELNWDGKYDAFIAFRGGVISTETTMNVSIEYQDVSNMNLPARIRFAGIHGSQPVEAELRFNRIVLIVD